jgi:hypothetical protein
VRTCSAASTNEGVSYGRGVAATEDARERLHTFGVADKRPESNSGWWRLRGALMRSPRTFNGGEWRRGDGGSTPAVRIGRVTRGTAGICGIGRRGRGDFRSGGAERVGRVLKCPSRQRLAQVGGRARFALSTPTSAGRGRADGGAPKFICRSGTDGGLFRAIFCPQPANRWLFCGLGDLGVLLEFLLKSLVFLCYH